MTTFEKRPELLAPAGTLETVPAVLDAGADAVYLGGKRFNMRMHRPSYNLNDQEIAEAISLTHARGKKLYFVLNNMMVESDLVGVREVLAMLGKLQPDAIIVQDLAVAALAREVCVHIPLHASTMMNVHSIETARILKLLGFSRVIPSRDIPLHEVRRIGQESGLEMEYFVHGDMCITQSSHCLLSGLLFGESSNRGRCMKPCRWRWLLIEQTGSVEMPGTTEGFLLARKDMCMFQHIPELVQNGIVAFKIEGRMRSAEFLVPIVAAYRRAIDAYFADPAHWQVDLEAMSDLFARRVRNYTVAYAFGNPGAASVDTTGRREPRFFSEAGPRPVLSASRNGSLGPLGRPIELIVHVADLVGGQAAMSAGAEAVYLGGEQLVRGRRSLDAAELVEFCDQARKRRVRVVVLSPRITDQRDLSEWQWWLRKIGKIEALSVGVGNLGALEVARQMGFKDIVADFSLNVCNSVTVDELSTLGVTRVTASVELDFEQLSQFVAKSRLPIEVIGQGPVAGMVLEHCVIAAAAGDSPQTVCPMYCRRGSFLLRDRAGNDYLMESDRRCRNYIFTPSDVCVLPNLTRLLSIGIAGLRIEAVLDTAETTAAIVRTYRQAIDALQEDTVPDAAEWVQAIRTVVRRPLSDGAFAFQAVS